MAKAALIALVTGTIIDRSMLIKLNSPDIENVFRGAFADVRSDNVRVVDDQDTFFTSLNMLKLIEANDLGYKMIAEKAGISISDAEVAAMQRAVELRKEITEKMTPPTPPYPFAKVPEGWSVASHLQFIRDGKSVRRKSDAGYQLSVASAKAVWVHFSKKWAGVGHGGSVYVQYGGYNQSVYEVEGDRLKFGCQYVQRYELEQLALHMGWEFPTAK